MMAVHALRERAVERPPFGEEAHFAGDDIQSRLEVLVGLLNNELMTQEEYREKTTVILAMVFR
jgi:hypothetical protein